MFPNQKTSTNHVPTSSPSLPPLFLLPSSPSPALFQGFHYVAHHTRHPICNIPHYPHRSPGGNSFTHLTFNLIPFTL